MTHRFLLPTNVMRFIGQGIKEGLVAHNDRGISCTRRHCPNKQIAEAGDDGGKAAIITMRYTDCGLAFFLFCTGLYFFFFSFQF